MRPFERDPRIARRTIADVPTCNATWALVSEIHGPLNRGPPTKMTTGRLASARSARATVARSVVARTSLLVDHASEPVATARARVPSAVATSAATLAVDRHCPVLDRVQNSVPIVRTLALSDRPPECARA
jgi:hypothetical protein